MFRSFSLHRYSRAWHVTVIIDRSELNDASVRGRRGNKNQTNRPTRAAPLLQFR